MALTALLAASTLIAPVGGPIDATGTHLAYSRLEGERYRLVIDGRDAPVPARPLPFDVDLGKDAGGRLVAVYTRATGGDQDVRWIDVTTGRERRVPAASTARRDERGASVSRGRVAFVVDGPRRDRVLRAGLTAPDVAREDQLQLDETELAGDVLALTGSENDPVSDSGRGAVWFARGAGRPRRLLDGVNSVNQTTTYIAPQVSSRWVTAGEVHAGEGGDYSRVARAAPSSGAEQRASVPDAPLADFQAEEPQRGLEGLAIAGKRVYTSVCADSLDEPDCRLERTTLTWRKRTR